MGAKWAGETSYITWFVMDKRYKQKGIGSHLFARVMEELDHFNVVLDAVQGTEYIYHLHGLKKQTEIKTWTWSLNCVQKDCQDFVANTNFTIEEVSDQNIELVKEFDAQMHLSGRGMFWQVWLTSPASTVRIAVASGVCVGFAVARTSPQKNFARISPLYAETDFIAQGLIEEIMMALDHRCSEIDICYPEYNEEKLASALRSAGICANENQVSDEEISMSRKPISMKNSQFVYGVCMDSICFI